MPMPYFSPTVRRMMEPVDVYNINGAEKVREKQGWKNLLFALSNPRVKAIEYGKFTIPVSQNPVGVITSGPSEMAWIRNPSFCGMDLFSLTITTSFLLNQLSRRSVEVSCGVILKGLVIRVHGTPIFPRMFPTRPTIHPAFEKASFSLGLVPAASASRCIRLR